MNKSVLFLLTLTVGCRHPFIAFLIMTFIYFYSITTVEEKQQLQSLMSNIISNGKLFTQYLSRKAKELNITMPQLRKAVITNLEIPEVTEEEFDNNEYNYFYNLEDHLSKEEIEESFNNSLIKEKVAAVIKESLAQPELLWNNKNLTLNDYFSFDEPDVYENNISIIEDKEYYNIKSLDYSKVVTPKYFRTISKLLKTVGKNELNEIVNEDMYNHAQKELKDMTYYFTNGTYRPMELFI